MDKNTALMKVFGVFAGICWAFAALLQSITVVCDILGILGLALFIAMFIMAAKKDPKQIF